MKLKHFWHVIVTMIQANHSAKPSCDEQRSRFQPTPVYRRASSKVNTVPMEMYAPELRHFELIGGKN